MGCGCGKGKKDGGYRAARSDRPRLSNRKTVSRPAKLIRRVKQKDSLICPKCGSLLKKVIRQQNRTKTTLLQCVNKSCTYARKA